MVHVLFYAQGYMQVLFNQERTHAVCRRVQLLFPPHTDSHLQGTYTSKPLILSNSCLAFSVWIVQVHLVPYRPSQLFLHAVV